MNRFFPKTLYDWYLLALGVLVSLPILAPITKFLGLHAISKIIYFLYSFTCHQFHTRSLYLLDNQFAWCARDTGIWFGFFVVALLLKKKKIKPIRYIWLPLLLLPMILDGGIQTINSVLNFPLSAEMVTGYYSNNLFRFMTGALFGTGLSMFFSRTLLEGTRNWELGTGIEKNKEQKTKNKENNSGNQEIKQTKNFQFPTCLVGRQVSNFQSLLFLIAIYFISYFTFIQIWNVTSSTNKPTNILDTVSKVEAEQFFLRRKDGECPVDATKDFFDFECLLGNDK